MKNLMMILSSTQTGSSTAGHKTLDNTKFKLIKHANYIHLGFSITHYEYQHCTCHEGIAAAWGTNLKVTINIVTSL